MMQLAGYDTLLSSVTELNAYIRVTSLYTAAACLVIGGDL